jgi:hypothetical protein
LLLLLLSRLLLPANSRGRTVCQRRRDDAVSNFAKHTTFQLVLQQLKHLHLQAAVRANTQCMLKVGVAQRRALRMA